MIADFERRLAEVLGGRLSAPFGGQVVVAPGDGVVPPLVVVGVRDVALLDDEFGHWPERVPGADDARRVVRLSCNVGLTVRATSAGGRAQEVAGVDALLYSADAADLRDGSALRPTGDDDPGFLVDRLQLAGGTLSPAAADGPPPESAGPPRVDLVARGWFWPAGTPGETGVRIGELWLRGLVVPIALSPRPAPVAGGAALPLTLRIGPPALLRLTDTPPAPPLPFGTLAVRLFGPGNRPPAGSLTGGNPGADGSRLLDVAGGAASFGYTPPAAPAVDQLVVALDDGTARQGLELARFSIRVRRA